MIASIYIISIILQSVLSNFLSTPNTILHPLFSLSALIVVFPYFKNKNYYLFSAFLYGMCYDILFSEMLFINCFLFFLLAVIILILNKQWNNTLLNIVLFQVIVILIYQNFMYFLVAIITKIEWNSIKCFTLVFNSLPINIIYIILIYIITNKISEKFKIDKIY